MPSALFVGASRGIGAGLVAEHLKRDWTVTATARGRSDDLEALRPKFLDRMTIESADIVQPATIEALAGRLRGHSFDLLFLNAGIMTGRGLDLRQVPDADVVSIFMTNAVSPIRTADTLLDLVSPGGTVAFMSSILGSIGTNEDGRAELYRASKAALNSLIRSFRARHASADLTVLAVHPGVVRTAMGGPTAPLDIDTSVQGVTAVLEKRRGSGGTAFVDYRNEIIPW